MWAAIPALVALVPNRLPSWIEFTPDARTLAFVTAITAGTAMLAGAVPAGSASRLNLVETLKEGGRGSTPGGAKAWFRSGLVVAEVAMSVLLLAGAGLMVETFWKLNRMQAGYRTENLDDAADGVAIESLPERSGGNRTGAADSQGTGGAAGSDLGGRRFGRPCWTRGAAVSRRRARRCWG